MINEKIYNLSCLTQHDYYSIENSVANLFSKLNIKKIPIEPIKIAQFLGYEVIPYSQIDEEVRIILRNQKLSGMSGRTQKGKYRIFYDDSDCKNRQRFTIMHEIGHIQMGHKEDSTYAEKCANYYASYALVPTSVISIYGCDDYIDVANLFCVSDECASYAFDRYLRWAKLSNRLKNYESKINLLFE